MKCKMCKDHGWIIVGFDEICHIPNKEPCPDCSGKQPEEQVPDIMDFIEPEDYLKDMPEEEVLKPCPFCGSKAAITHDPMFGSDSSTEYYRIQCTNKDCSMGRPDALFDSEEQIIGEWNTRTGETE